MKLIHHTISKLSIVMIIILTFWAGFFFYSILDEILDETDDSLENYKHLIIQQVLRDTAAIHNSSDLMSQYFIKEISENEAIHYKERYFDSTRFYEIEYDFDPVRVLKTAFRGQDKKFYELTIMISTLEQDDMIEAILWSIVILYVTLLICILIVSEFVFRKSLAPFYKLLNWLNQFTLGGKNLPLDNPTKIKEFRQLNETILKMTRRNEEMYSQQKQFIENASHELQTPLAVINGKLELLAEHENLDEEELKNIDDMFRSLHRAIQLNKSLLLLSRIQNRQFEEVTEVNMNPHVRKILELLSDLYEEKELDYHLSDTEDCRIRMNESLAHTLLTNLIKNAIIHSPEHGRVDILIHSTRIEIVNDGNQALDERQMFKRFYKGHSGQKESTGLGLSIAQSIADLYHLSLTYYHDGRHHFVLKVAKP